MCFSKKIVLAMVWSVCFVVLSAMLTQAQADVLWLHVERNQILDSNNEVVRLRGLNPADPEMLANNREGMNSIGLVDLASQKFCKMNVWRSSVHPFADNGEGSQGWFADPDNYFNSYLDPVVQHCVELGIYVIIDLHFVSHYNESQRDQYVIPFWTYIADKYKNCPNVVFEIYNEAIRYNADVNASSNQGDASWDKWLEIMAQPVVDHVRSIASNNLIIVGGPIWAQNMDAAVDNPVQAENIAYTAHIYPYHSSVSWDSNYGRLIQNAPVFVTEWGYENGAPIPCSGTTSDFGLQFMEWMDDHNLSWVAFAFDTNWKPRMFNVGWVIAGGEDRMGEFVQGILGADCEQKEFTQAIGKPIGTPNWGYNMVPLNDGVYSSWTEMDEVCMHKNWPFSYFGVKLTGTVFIPGMRFRNNTREWNHFEEVEVYILPPNTDFLEENVVKVVDTTSTRMKLDWVEFEFDKIYQAKTIWVRYTKITGNWAAPVAELELLNAVYLPGIDSLAYPDDLVDPIVVTFSEEMDTDSIDLTTFFIKDQAGQKVEGLIDLEEDGQTLIFQPTEALQRSSSYSVYLLSSISTPDDRMLSSDYKYDFETKVLYLIKATSNEYGSIEPGGDVLVNDGATQLLRFYPEPNCQVERVVVDGIEQDISGAYSFINVDSDHDIHVDFGHKDVLVMITTSGFGDIDPLGGEYVPYGSDLTITMLPNLGYHLSDILVNGVSVGIQSPFVLENVVEKTDVKAIFSRIPDVEYEITTSTGSNGSVNPEGLNFVKEGTSLVVVASPDVGYEVDKVIVDGIEYTSLLNYTFNDVHSDHDIHVTFKPNEITVSINVVGQGTVNPSVDITVFYRDDLNIDFEASEGWLISEVKVDGQSVAKVSPLVLEDIKSNKTVIISFTEIPQAGYRILSSSGPNGEVLPEGEITVSEGISQLFTFKADPGYKLDKVLIDGVDNNGLNSYTFVNVDAEHEIRASFVEIEQPDIGDYVISVSSGEHGSMSPSGDVAMEAGRSQYLRFSPDEGYQVDKVIVDGEEKFVPYGYFFFNVTENHDIQVSFKLKEYQIFITSVGLGNVEPNGFIYVTTGDDLTLDINPREGWFVNDIQVDGSSIGASDSYTLENVVANTRIRVDFKKLPKPQYTIVSSSGANGNLSEEGNMVVYEGQFKVLYFEPDPGYQLASLTVDGNVVDAGMFYVFHDINSDHEIHAEFETAEYRIFINGSPLFDIQPSGTVYVKHGNDLEISIQASEDRVYTDLVVDQESFGPKDTYVLKDIDSNHWVFIRSERRTHTIESSVLSGDGSISPDGVKDVFHGFVYFCWIKPDQGYSTKSVIVDGQDLGPMSFLRISDVKENHNVSVVFEMDADHNQAKVLSKNVGIKEASAFRVSTVQAEEQSIREYGFEEVLDSQKFEFDENESNQEDEVVNKPSETVNGGGGGCFIGSFY